MNLRDRDRDHGRLPMLLAVGNTVDGRDMELVVSFRPAPSAAALKIPGLGIRATLSQQRIQGIDNGAGCGNDTIVTVDLMRHGCGSLIHPEHLFEKVAHLPSTNRGYMWSNEIWCRLADLHQHFQKPGCRRDLVKFV